MKDFLQVGEAAYCAPPTGHELRSPRAGQGGRQRRTVVIRRYRWRCVMVADRPEHLMPHGDTPSEYYWTGVKNLLAR